MNFNIFLKWWLHFLLVCASIFFLHRFEFFQFLLSNDKSYLSFLIIFIFLICSVLCGITSWRLSNSIQKKRGIKLSEIDEYKRREEVGWFCSELLLSIGMIGTVYGFILMLKNFAFINIENIDTIQSFIVELGLGMSTALLTTLVGLVCSSSLKIQYFVLSQTNMILQSKKENN